MARSAKTEYACVALLELAKLYTSGKPVQVKNIASAHGIPQQFLVQILLQLKNAGLVDSTRGAGGGYQLVVPPAQVTIAEIIDVMDGKQKAVSQLDGSPLSLALNEVFDAAVVAEQEVYSKVTLEQLVVRTLEKENTMYFI